MEISTFTIQCDNLELLQTELIKSIIVQEFDVDQEPYVVKLNDKTLILYYESYSMRVSNRLMISVIMREDTERHQVHLEVICGGGKDNLGFSMGAEKSRIKIFLNLLWDMMKKQNWSFIEADENLQKFIDKKLK